MQEVTKALGAFGITASSYPRPMTREKLLELLAQAEPHFPDVPCTLVPTSFDPEDPELRAFPRPLQWRWKSAEETLRAFGSRGILMRLPLFWQVEPALFAAGQAVGAPIFVNDQDNMPVGAAAIRDASMDTVVTDGSDAERFSRLLLERGADFPTNWLIVYTLAEAWGLPPVLASRKARAAREVHLFPGVTVLAQCKTLTAQPGAVFHAVDDWKLEREGTTVFLTSATADPLPLIRYALEIPLREDGRCACGKTRLTRG